MFVCVCSFHESPGNGGGAAGGCSAFLTCFVSTLYLCVYMNDADCGLSSDSRLHLLSEEDCAEVSQRIPSAKLSTTQQEGDF